MRRDTQTAGRSWWLGLAVLLMLAGAPATAAGPALALPKPDPSLDPVTVVKLQLEALAHVDQPVKDAGLAVVFRFASPGNQAQTGRLEKFSRMIRSGYAEMLNHRSATVVKSTIDGDQALEAVELIDRAGVLHRYVFILSRQSEAPYKDCWMTDGVVNAPGEAGKVEA